MRRRQSRPQAGSSSSGLHDHSVRAQLPAFTALKVRKTTSGDADKVYWFVKGVGKVKEEGEQVENLTAYTLP